MNTLYCITLSFDDFRAKNSCQFITQHNGKTAWHIMGKDERSAIQALAAYMAHPCFEMTKREIDGVFVSVYSIELDWAKGPANIIHNAGTGIMVGTGVSGYIKNFR